MKLALILLSLLSFSARASVGGTEVGNGGDNFSIYHDVAWFLGEKKPVTACLKISKDFPLSAGEASAAIGESYKQWIGYIEEKRVYEEGYTLPPEESTPRTASLRFARELRLSSTCDGSEDLVFYLGSAPIKVEKIRRAYVDPVSFVHREKYSAAEGWSRGFVWVGAKGLAGRPWTTPYLFQSTMLHELGHIFGVGHVPGTIMSQNFVRETTLRLEAAEDEEDRYGTLSQIDTWRQLFTCLNCDISLKNVVPTALEEKLLGRKVKGPINCGMNFQDRFLWEFTLDCQDQSGNHLWRITPSYDPRFVSSGIEVFKRAVVIPGQSEITRESVRALNGQVIYGKLVTANGGAHNVVVERNLGGESPIFTVNLLSGGEVELLFEAIKTE